jgi:hypothetical protein
LGLALIKPSLQELRQLVGALGAVDESQRKKSAFSLFQGGFHLGSFVEIFGAGKTQLISQFLKEHQEFKTLWIETEISINPYGLFQKGVKVQNVLFIEAKKEMNWCLTQGLNSGCFNVTVIHGQTFNEKELRRIQLLNEKNQSHVFLLSEAPHKSWVPQLQLNVTKHKEEITIEIHRQRGFS